MDRELLRMLPKVDVLAEQTGMRMAERMGMPDSGMETLLEVPKSGYAGLSANGLAESARNVLARLRQEILEGECTSLPDNRALCRLVEQEYRKNCMRSLRPVINATGIILHTNLGRSILSPEAAEAAKQAASCYTNLEYRLDEGIRGSRYDHMESQLLRLCGGEAAMVVNNNAAAIMLILSTMARGRTVVISRGELVEIGGSFRVPEIMEMSGCRLKEVGSTNKTRRADYERAVDEDTAAILKVHTSNFRMTGFTEEVPLKELAALGKQTGLPVIYDMGSGSLVPMNLMKGVCEPNTPEAVGAGADIICFSGDKLLGGPQAGIIIGRKQYVKAMKANPLARALRVDKMTLAALEATLFQYLDGSAWKNIPTLAMLGMSAEGLREKCMDLIQHLSDIPGISLAMVEDQAPAGGGSIPGVMFPACCASVSCDGISTEELEHLLRMLPRPIIARIHEGKLLLDSKTMKDGDMEIVRDGFMQISKMYVTGGEIG
uniref:L-seryl-tRNA(Sec) selenium transferase n=1 Tax=Enterocloster aldenensis TaxID=358742 RepID=UPI0035680645